MTTAVPDGVLTAGDLLFGSQENAQEALRRHVMADGRAFARSLVHLPRVTREAAVREAAVAGRGHVGVALTIHEIEVLTKRSHLELPGQAGLKRGFRLLPASHYPDEPPSHPSGAHPGGQVPAAEPMSTQYASAGH